MGRQVEEYSQLIARAFNGAITVNGQRIVAHPSGTLIVRGGESSSVRGGESSSARGSSPNLTPPGPLDRDNDWSDV